MFFWCIFVRKQRGFFDQVGTAPTIPCHDVSFHYMSWFPIVIAWYENLAGWNRECFRAKTVCTNDNIMCWALQIVVRSKFFSGKISTCSFIFSWTSHTDSFIYMYIYYIYMSCISNISTNSGKFESGLGLAWDPCWPNSELPLAMVELHCVSDTKSFGWWKDSSTTLGWKLQFGDISAKCQQISIM